jgi:hypothetical protein
MQEIFVIINSNAQLLRNLIISRELFCFLEVFMAKARSFRIRPQQFSLMLSEDEMTTLKEQAKLLKTKPSYILREYIATMDQQRKAS